MNKTIRVSLIVVLLSLLLVGRAVAPVSAWCKEPVYKGALVDGNPVEWAGDPVFADLYRADDPCKPVEAYLRLRYDCVNNVMFVLVLSKDSLPVQQNLSETWVKVDLNPNKVVFSSFAWVMDGSVAIGWEASFPLSEATHFIKVHTNVWDDGEWQTSSTCGVCVSIDCPPNSVVVAGFSASPYQGIKVSWETASEVNNLGFNLYRTDENNYESPTKVKLNDVLIPSQAPGGVVGATYTYLDATAIEGVPYYYWLEDIEADGDSRAMGVHGPASGQWNKPSVISVTPTSGGKVYNQFRLFTAAYSDVDGDLEKVYLKISDTSSATGVVVQYTRSTKAFTVSGPGILGTTKKAALSANGQTLTITVQLKFKKNFRGQHNTYLRAEDMPGNSSDWILSGTWKVK